MGNGYDVNLHALIMLILLMMTFWDERNLNKNSVHLVDN